MIDKVEGSEPGARGEKNTQIYFYEEKSSVGTTGSNNGFLTR